MKYFHRILLPDLTMRPDFVECVHTIWVGQFPVAVSVRPEDFSFKLYRRVLFWRTRTLQTHESSDS